LCPLRASKVRAST